MNEGGGAGAVERPSAAEAIAGGLIGLAAGDALGATVEFLSPEQIRSRYGVHREIAGGGPFGWRPGQGTDDTDLTWAVTAAYLDGEYSLQKAADGFLGWLDSDPPDIGNATRQALRRLAESGDPTSSGGTHEYSCGNGSLMRALPTGLVRTDAEQRRREAAEISAVTHAHPRCIDSCIAYTEMAAALLDGRTTDGAIAQAAALDLHPDVHDALAAPPEKPVEELRTSGYVIHSLICAVWAIQQPADFETLIVSLVNQGDDADTTGAIAGGLLGVLTGADAIPARWRETIKYGPRMEQAARRLAELRNPPGAE